MMKIPTSFKLYGLEITTEYDSNLYTERRELGLAVYTKNIIVLQPIEEAQLKHDQLEQVFCHELVHHILEKMGETKMCENEKFVDGFALLLHQALTTMTYENDD